jgi:hypothetical protein
VAGGKTVCFPWSLGSHVTEVIMPLLPTIALGPHRVTRLICGGNPFSGYSHTSSELDWEMRRYFTMPRLQAILDRCLECGINTVQSRGDRHQMRMILEHRERDGQIQWIAQTASEFADIGANIREISAYQPIAIYHHGTHVDNRWHAGRIGEIGDVIKRIRDTGLPTGLGTHIPAVVLHAEEQGWPIDFYMCCLYNLAPGPKRVAATQGVDPNEKFVDSDRDLMLSVVRQLKKPVLAFKPLAASRKGTSRDTVREAFKYAYDRIKPTDAVVVGMFPKHKDQVAENAEIVRELIG